MTTLYQFNHGLAAHKEIEEVLFVPISISGPVMHIETDILSNIRCIMIFINHND